MKTTILFCVVYQFLGQRFSTVVAARTAQEARFVFQQQNPGVTVVDVIK